MEQGSSPDNTDGKTANRDTETDLALNALFPATEPNRTIVISLPKRKKKRITVIVLPLHRTIPFYYSNGRSVNVLEL